jgi:hypothetical protein
VGYSLTDPRARAARAVAILPPLAHQVSWCLETHRAHSGQQTRLVVRLVCPACMHESEPKLYFSKKSSRKLIKSEEPPIF